MTLEQLIEAYKDKYLELADRDIEKAFSLAVADIGLAKSGQSAGFHRVGITNSTLEIKEPPYIPDPDPING